MSDTTSRIKGFFNAVPATRHEKWLLRLVIVIYMAFMLAMGVVLGTSLGILHDNKSPNYVDRERAWCEAVPGRVYDYYAGVCYTGVVKIPKNVSEGARAQDIVIEEDGSGTQYSGDREIRTFPAGTFAWDCTTMGDRLCTHTAAG